MRWKEYEMKKRKARRATWEIPSPPQSCRWFVLSFPMPFVPARAPAICKKIYKIGYKREINETKCTKISKLELQKASKLQNVQKSDLVFDVPSRPQPQRPKRLHPAHTCQARGPAIPQWLDTQDNSSSNWRQTDTKPENQWKSFNSVFSENFTGMYKTNALLSWWRFWATWFCPPQSCSAKQHLQWLNCLCRQPQTPAQYKHLACHDANWSMTFPIPGQASISPRKHVNKESSVLQLVATCPSDSKGLSLESNLWKTAQGSRHCQVEPRSVQLEILSILFKNSSKFVFRTGS